MTNTQLVRSRAANVCRCASVSYLPFLFHIVRRLDRYWFACSRRSLQRAHSPGRATKLYANLACDISNLPLSHTSPSFAVFPLQQSCLSCCTTVIQAQGTRTNGAYRELNKKRPSRVVNSTSKELLMCMLCMDCCVCRVCVPAVCAYVECGVSSYLNASLFWCVCLCVHVCVCRTCRF